MESLGGGLCMEVGLCSATFFLFREPVVVTLVSNSNSGTGAEVEQAFLVSFWITPNALVCTRRKKQAKKSTWTGFVDSFKGCPAIAPLSRSALGRPRIPITDVPKIEICE